VDSAETRRALPPLRRQVVVVTRAMQSAPSGFARELARAKKQGRRNLVEVRLAEAASRKRAYVVGEVTEAFAGGGKGVIFTGRHADCERLGDALRKAAPTVAIWVAHGGHGTGVRDEIREAYMAHAGPCAIVGTGEAWGESFNLQDTDLAVFAQLPINYRQLWQWEGRFARHGQRRPVRVLYPVAEGSIDEHLQSILLDKLPAVAKLHGDSQAAEAERALQGRDRDDEIVSRLFEKIAGVG
jgi:superfamily II DNA helicase RecQ